jgi:hypothetical protein
LSGCSQEDEKYHSGRARAKRELAQGQINIAFADPIKEPFYSYAELLRSRYHISWCVYSLPGNPKAAEAWVRGYNEVMLPRIESQFGTNILKQTLADAQKLHDSTTTRH